MSPNKNKIGIIYLYSLSYLIPEKTKVYIKFTMETYWVYIKFLYKTQKTGIHQTCILVFELKWRFRELESNPRWEGRGKDIIILTPPQKSKSDIFTFEFWVAEIRRLPPRQSNQIGFNNTKDWNNHSHINNIKTTCISFFIIIYSPIFKLQILFCFHVKYKSSRNQGNIIYLSILRWFSWHSKSYAKCHENKNLPYIYIRD